MRAGFFQGLGALVVITIGVLACDPVAAYAQNGNTIYACVAKGQGLARIVPADVACRPNETRVSWNVMGPQGPAGPQGEPGPAGPSGDNCVVIASLPVRITTPGRYCLDRNFQVSLTEYDGAITIAADDVVLDLKGFSITNTADQNTSWAIGILVNGRSVTVRNGTIRRFLYGVYFLESSASDYGLVEHIRAIDSSYGGIRVESNATVIRHNHVVNTHGGSPYASEGWPATAAGIGAYGTNHRLVDNDVADTHGRAGAEGWGIWMNACDDCIVQGNRVGNATADATSVGIGGGFSVRTLIVGNRIVNVNVGIYAYTAGGILYRDNVTFGCTVPYGTGTDGGNNR